MEPYGLALPKLKARKLGINPVWYVDMTTGHTWHLAQALDQLRDNIVAQAAADNRNFHQSRLARLFPFIEQMGTWPNRSSKEFWWEREWRHAGNFSIPASGVMCGSAPRMRLT